MLAAADKKSLEEILSSLKKLEASSLGAGPDDSSKFTFPAAELKELQAKITALQNSSDPNVQKLASVAIHLHPQMSVKHFVAFLVPFERLLNKNIQDDDFLVATQDKTMPITQALPLVFVLDNIRSAFNVGAILRTAECLHIEKVYLCGYTPTPEQEKLAKTAMGTHESVPWEHREDILSLLQELQFKAYNVVALETADKAVDLYEKFPFTPTALVVGNERFGLDLPVLKACSEIRKIPLRGRKNSLNVGISLAVAAFEWNRQYGK